MVNVGKCTNPLDVMGILKKIIEKWALKLGAESVPNSRPFITPTRQKQHQLCRLHTFLMFLNFFENNCANKLIKIYPGKFIMEPKTWGVGRRCSFFYMVFFRFQPLIFRGVHHLMAKHQIFPTTQAHAAINKPYLFLIEAGRWPGHSVVRLRIVRP